MLVCVINRHCAAAAAVGPQLSIVVGCVSMSISRHDWQPESNALKAVIVSCLSAGSEYETKRIEIELN